MRRTVTGALAVGMLAVLALPSQAGVAWRQPLDLSGPVKSGFDEDVGAYDKLVVAAWTRNFPRGNDRNQDEVFAWVSKFGGSAWSGSVNLSNDDTMYDGFPSVAASSTSAVVGWWSYADYSDDQSNNAIKVARFVDGAWTAPQEISGDVDPTTLGYPHIVSDGSSYYAVWGNNFWYFSRSTDGGATWSQPIPEIDAQYFPTIDPAIAASGESLTVIWRGDRPGELTRDLYSKSSSDGGQTWGPQERLTDSNDGEYYQDVGASGQTVVAAWEERTQEGSFLTVARSADSGAHWDAPQRLGRLRLQRGEQSYRPFIDVVGTNRGFEIYVTGVRPEYRRYVSTDGAEWRTASFPLKEGIYTGISAVATGSTRHFVTTRAKADLSKYRLLYLHGVER